MGSFANDNKLTLYVGNIAEKVDEELLYELFVQAGPVKGVHIPKDHKTGGKRNFAFVTFKQEVTVEYAINLLKGQALCGRTLNLKKKHNKSDAQSKASNDSKEVQSKSLNEGVDISEMHLNDVDGSFTNESMYMQGNVAYDESCGYYNSSADHNQFYGNELNNECYYPSNPEEGRAQHKRNAKGKKGPYNEGLLVRGSPIHHKNSQLYSNNGFFDEFGVLYSNGRSQMQPRTNGSPGWKRGDHQNSIHPDVKRRPNDPYLHHSSYPEMHKRHHPYSPRFGR